MQTTLALGPSWLDPVNLIESMGSFALWGVVLVIFAECGLLIGFFLPGDSLLFTLGLLIATGTVDTPLWLAATAVSVAAIAGNLVGYWIGRQAGPALFSRPDSQLFKHEHVERTHAFFEKYGARAIVLARFVLIVRTFITVTAGVARMDARVYVTYSSIGGVIWGAGVTILGYFLGQFDIIRDHIDVILLVIVFVIGGIVLASAVPVGVQLLRTRRRRRDPRPVGATEDGGAPVDGPVAIAHEPVATADDPVTTAQPPSDASLGADSGRSGPER